MSLRITSRRLKNRKSLVGTLVSSAALAAFSSGTAHAQCNPEWSAMPGLAPLNVKGVASFESANGPVLLSAMYMPTLQQQYVYRWTGQQWTSFLPGGGTALKVHSGTAGPEVISTSQADVWRWRNGQIEHLATRTWDTANLVWKYSLPGVFDTKAIAVFDSGSGEALYAGGTGASTTTVYKHIAGKSWSPVGTFTGGFGVTSMTVFDDGQGEGPMLFAAGSFTAVNGVPAVNIAKFNGTTWSAVGPAGFNPGPSARLVVHAGMLYANSWAWDGWSWFNVGRGSSLNPLQVLDLGHGPELFSISDMGLEKWSVCFWMPLDDGISAGALLSGAAVFEENGRAKLAVGGTFTSCGPVTLPNLAMWTPAMTADMNDDAAVDISDLMQFLNAFETGSDSGDVDNGTGSGGRDSAVTIDDLLHYLRLFEAGC